MKRRSPSSCNGKWWRHPWQAAQTFVALLRYRRYSVRVSVLLTVRSTYRPLVTTPARTPAPAAGGDDE